MWNEAGDAIRLPEGFPESDKYNELHKHRVKPQPCQRIPYQKNVTPIASLWNSNMLIEDKHLTSLWLWPGSLIKNGVSGLYALGFFNVQKSGVAGNQHNGCTGVFVSAKSQEKYPNNIVYDSQDIWFVDYYVTNKKKKLLSISALQGEPFGLFVGPSLSDVYITEAEKTISRQQNKDKILYRFRLYPVDCVHVLSINSITPHIRAYALNFTRKKARKLHTQYHSTTKKIIN